MKRWLVPLCLLIGQTPLPGQGTAAAVQKGEAALAEGLVEIAELHFRQALADPTPQLVVKSATLLLLAETLVRMGNFTEALDLTSRSTAGKTDDWTFWKAQALLGLGRLNEASAMLAPLAAKGEFPWRLQAGFARASLQLALGQAEAALETLTAMIDVANPSAVAKIRLYQVEILLDLHRPADARQVMPAKDSVAAMDRPQADFLEASLLLEEGHAAEAEAGFQALLVYPRGQSETRFHAAAIGLADAIQAQGHPTEAMEALLAFIQEHRDSPLMAPMFDRILKWMPPGPGITDPVLERIAQWISPSELPTTGPLAINDSAVSAWPTIEEPSASDNLTGFALYSRALGLHRLGTAEANATARHLLARLRLEMPSHPLAGQALLEMARWALDEGKLDLAISMLDGLRGDAPNSEVKGEAAFIAGEAAYRSTDTAHAATLFEEAAKSLAGDEARAAQFNAAISRVRSAGLSNSTLIRQAGPPVDPVLEADLELERVLANTDPTALRKAAEVFLTRSPDHPRAAEVRLAAAESTLAGASPDLSFAKAQLDTLDAVEKKPANFPIARVALARLRIADLSHDPATAIAAAQALMDTYHDTPEAAEAALVLGRNLFQTGSYNPARLVLEKLAASDTDPLRAQVAWLLAARSAALGGTPRSKEEALILFDKAIELKGPLASIAALEKSRHLIDIARLPEACGFLRKWTAPLSANDPLRLPAGLLLGEALYAQGSTNSASLVEALAVYDGLLANAAANPALMNRLQYLRGMTLEQLPDEKNPSKKREKQAFQAYYSVLETTEAPAEWEYFERCGFRALALLEKAKRWQVSITVAKKIASFKGPRSAEAAARASKLQLEHMIMED